MLILIKELELIKESEILGNFNLAHVNIYPLIFENLKEYLTKFSFEGCLPNSRSCMEIPFQMFTSFYTDSSEEK